jgi:hypothetical protein
MTNWARAIFYSTGSCAAARFVLIEQPYRQKIKAVFPSRRGDHGQWHHFDSYHQVAGINIFGGLCDAFKNIGLGNPLQLKLGFPFPGRRLDFNPGGAGQKRADDKS